MLQHQAPTVAEWEISLKFFSLFLLLFFLFEASLDGVNVFLKLLTLVLSIGFDVFVLTFIPSCDCSVLLFRLKIFSWCL